MRRPHRTAPLWGTLAAALLATAAPAAHGVEPLGPGEALEAKPVAEVAEIEPQPAEPDTTPADRDIDALLAEAGGRPLPAPEAGPSAADALPGSLSARYTRTRDRVAVSLRSLAAEARRRLPESARPAFDDLATLTFSPAARTVLIHALAGVLVVLLALRLVRGRGDLAVCVEYPAELRGTFNVRIAKNPARARRQSRRHGRIANPADARRARRRVGKASRTEHPMVSRETQFRDVLARRWVVTVDGFLQPAHGEEVLATRLEEQEVRVRRNETVRAVFDLRPKECHVELKVLWDRRPVENAQVALRGAPWSLRGARGGVARLGVSLGRHVIVVGSGDRVAELEVEADSLQPVSLEVDLGGRENVVFAGCPPAVELYLHGDVPAAARALEREGQCETSHLLLARFHEEPGQLDAAARHFESAGCAREAAELRERLEQFDASAALYEKAGDSRRAADMYRSAGDLVRAGEAYERARQFDSAAECFREADDVERWIAALERAGEPYQAARVAMERDDWRRAIQSLQQVPPSHVSYVEASEHLVDAYKQAGHLDLAARKLEEVVERQGGGEAPVELCDRLAILLEETGELGRALEALETIRRRDPTLPNLATRIENLRKRQSEQQTKPVTGPGAPMAAEGFAGEGSRYEILGEIGRGGMGVVFKARDRRLGRVVALKRLPENLRNHPKAVELFLREARAAAALNHANIVTLFDAGHENESYYITMELLQGSPVQAILKKRGRLTPRDTARLGLQITAGLQYAHDQRIVHRDIKTGNLFFTKNKQVKIMDFGLAKMIEEVRRASTVIGGTPYYMAPEQSAGKPVDHRADLYALGVTFFELLTGKVPFFEGDVAYQHRHAPPPDPRERAPDIPGELAELVLALMSKMPVDRPDSAAAVAERLKRCSA